MHTLNIQLDVDENSGEIEYEICVRLQEVITNAVSLLNFNANHVLVTDIRKES